jgi:acetoin utilization deacetylase AcuC-like enzyme
MKNVWIIFQQEVAEHDFGPTHPLRKERLTLYIDRLRSSGLLDNLGIQVVSPEARVCDDDILAVHDPSLLNTIKEISETGGRLDADTPLPRGTHGRACLQAGGLLYGGQAVMEGKCDCAIQLIAFGGHHAMRRHERITFGFCYLNQEAITLRALQRQGYIKKALVIDCDCHHGNGIQDIFYDDSSVLYVSLHQDPATLYPGAMGYAEEVGTGKGEGYNVNVPLSPGTTCPSYLRALEEIFPPLAREFQPDLVLAIMNGDNHFMDPLTDMGIDLPCYPKIAKVISDVANDLCGGKLLVELGGGYDLKVADSSSYSITLTFAAYDDFHLDDPYGTRQESPQIAERVDSTLTRVKEIQAKYWRSFQRGPV